MEEYIEKLVMQKAELNNSLGVALTLLDYFVDISEVSEVPLADLELREPINVSIHDGKVILG